MPLFVADIYLFILLQTENKHKVNLEQFFPLDLINEVVSFWS